MAWNYKEGSVSHAIILLPLVTLAKNYTVISYTFYNGYSLILNKGGNSYVDIVIVVLKHGFSLTGIFEGHWKVLHWEIMAVNFSDFNQLVN